jgi:hypothetical protein
MERCPRLATKPQRARRRKRKKKADEAGQKFDELIEQINIYCHRPLMR